MIQVRRGFFPPFWIIILLTLTKQIAQKKSLFLLLIFFLFFFFLLWDQNLALCGELDTLKHEVGTEQCSEKSQL